MFFGGDRFLNSLLVIPCLNPPPSHWEWLLILKFRIRSDNPFASAEWDGVLGLAQDRYADWSNRIQQGLESWGELEKRGWLYTSSRILSGCQWLMLMIEPILRSRQITKNSSLFHRKFNENALRDRLNPQAQPVWQKSAFQSLSDHAEFNIMQKLLEGANVTRIWGARGIRKKMFVVTCIQDNLPGFFPTAWSGRICFYFNFW